MVYKRIEYVGTLQDKCIESIVVCKNGAANVPQDNVPRKS